LREGGKRRRGERDPRGSKSGGEGEKTKGGRRSGGFSLGGGRGGPTGPLLSSERGVVLGGGKKGEEEKTPSTYGSEGGDEGRKRAASRLLFLCLR